MTADASGIASATIEVKNAQPHSWVNDWHIAIDDNAIRNRTSCMPVTGGTVVVG
jgi:hypothetical protein